MQANDVSYQDIATAFGYKNKQTVRDYITGDVDSTKANELVLRIISKFRIRQKVINISRNWLSKKEFVDKYGYSDSTFNRRKEECLETQYRDAFIQPSKYELWIDEDIYQEFLIYKSKNRFKAKVEATKNAVERW